MNLRRSSLIDAREALGRALENHATWQSAESDTIDRMSDHIELRRRVERARRQIEKAIRLAIELDG